MEICLWTTLEAGTDPTTRLIISHRTFYNIVCRRRWLWLCVWVFTVQYISCLERIARAVGVSVIDRDLSIDEAAQLIIDRSQQLYDSRSRDQQSLIHTLQHKLKSLKERLDLKVINQSINRSVYLPDKTLNVKTGCNSTKLCQTVTSTKGTMNPEGSARNSCNSWPLYARWDDQRACFG